MLFADTDLQFFLNICITGLTTGFLYALIALGYTMVYGIVELINFAHGDLFMLGSFLALTVAGAVMAATGMPALAIALMLIAAPLFCAALNLGVDRIVYKPLRNAPKLAPLVSAIGVSFIFMNVGLFWGGSQDVNFPGLITERNLLGESSSIQFTTTDALVVAVTVPVMIALTFFVKGTSLGKAMRATAQNPVAARLMGINVDRVIGATFLIGGALAGIASVIYGLKIKTIGYQMGFQNGLYAFTAAVLGGIGNIPGAVLGAIVIGMVYSLASAYIDARWATAMIFVILIVILVFRPTGLLGARTREKV
jgi:branched-chain amino acid transport system permease protein